MRRAAPLALAVGAFGLSFGVLARASGMGPFAAVIMSATTFGGSAQFAAVSLLGTSGDVSAGVVSALLLNARYVPIGLSVAPSLRGGRLGRMLFAQLVVDESWAIGQRRHGVFDVAAITGAGLVLWAGWVAGTAIGVTQAGAVGDPSRLGLDAAFPALFIALLRPHLRDRESRLVALLGATVALALWPLLPPGVPILVAATSCLLGARRPGTEGGQK